jgi:hypothetical protein
MTRTEIEAFVRSVVRGAQYVDGDTEGRIVEQIADRWQEDTDDARENGIYDGFEASSGW